jgi:citrate synthase
MAKVLFEITEEQLETGLRGFPVGYCTTSYVDPQKGLYYGEYRVADIAAWKPEEVIYLIYYGKKGSPAEVKGLVSELHRRATLPPMVTRHVEQLPRQGHPMKLLSAALLICGMVEGKGDYREDCLNLIAKIPLLGAHVINHHAGWGRTPEPKPELGYTENFVHLLQIPKKGDHKHLAAVFNLFNILHYDHGGGNLSTFVGKAIASGLEDLYGSISGAISALEGPRHGKANQDCLQFTQEMLKQLGDKATEADVERFIRQKLAAKELVFGFGHAVLRVEDPRATLFYDYAKTHFSKDPLVHMALLLRKAGSKVLAENPKIADPHPNVDAASGVVLTAAGFPYPDYFPLLFGVSRAVGIARQIVYERVEARQGKGTPIVRPKYLYKKPS